MKWFLVCFFFCKWKHVQRYLSFLSSLVKSVTAFPVPANFWTNLTYGHIRGAWMCVVLVSSYSFVLSSFGALWHNPDYVYFLVISCFFLEFFVFVDFWTNTHLMSVLLPTVICIRVHDKQLTQVTYKKGSCKYPWWGKMQKPKSSWVQRKPTHSKQ